MNLEKLKRAESAFLTVYPKGFADPAMKAVRSKHNVHRLISYAQEALTPVSCQQPDHVAETLLRIVSRSSMVSRFEKPRFREFIESLGSYERETLAYAVEQRLFGKKQRGFELFQGMLAQYKIAKWAVISAVPFYFAPRREVFVKPTTAKGIIAFLEVDGLTYHASPTWSFYRGYRNLLAQVRREVSPSLSPSNAALSGFLMMSIR